MEVHFTSISEDGFHPAASEHRAMNVNISETFATAMVASHDVGGLETTTHHHHHHNNNNNNNNNTRIVTRPDDRREYFNAEKERFREVHGSWSTQFVLTFDGGPVFGLTQLFIVQRLMEKIKTIERNVDRNVASSAASRFTRPTTTENVFLPCHYFNYIGGTSMGGILAVLLGRLRMSIDDAIECYRKIWQSMARELSPFDKTRLLGHHKISDTKTFEQAIEAILQAGGVKATDNFLSSPGGCKTLVLSHQFTGATSRPFLFRSFDDQEEANQPGKFSRMAQMNREKAQRVPEQLVKRPGNLGNATSQHWGWERSFNIRDVCLATSAHPKHYHGVCNGSSIFRDGSTWNSNPSEEILHAVQKSSPNSRIILLNIGSGKLPKAPPAQVICCCLRLGSSPTAPSSRNVCRSLEHNQHLKDFQYIRIDSADADASLNAWRHDESGSVEFDRAAKRAEALFGQTTTEDQIDRFAYQLVEMRRKRALTPEWEYYALRIGYKCLGCEEAKIRSRSSLQQHLQMEHLTKPPDRMTFSQLEEIIKNSQISLAK